MADDITDNISIHSLWKSIKLSAEGSVGEGSERSRLCLQLSNRKQYSLPHRNKPLSMFIKHKSPKAIFQLFCFGREDEVQREVSLRMTREQA